MSVDTVTTAARFITLEGGEGVGKSTQVKRLAAQLERRRVPSIRTREPGGTPKAEAIRSFLLQGKPEQWGPGAEAVLFAAARHNHVLELIAPNLAKGTWVICDRFSDSTRAYQGLTGGVEDKLIDALEILALDGHKPDLTLVLDMDPDTALTRVAQRAVEDGTPTGPDRFERESLDWHRRLREAFLVIARNHAERCVVIAADGSEDDLETAIWEAVRHRFPELDAENSA
ncbi:MAG: dTMP kinase [Devosia sp.]|nr:dTMP kinase [Devosia sp.]